MRFLSLPFDPLLDALRSSDHLRRGIKGYVAPLLCATLPFIEGSFRPLILPPSPASGLILAHSFESTTFQRLL